MKKIFPEKHLHQGVEAQSLVNHGNGLSTHKLRPSDQRQLNTNQEEENSDNESELTDPHSQPPVPIIFSTGLQLGPTVYEFEIPQLIKEEGEEEEDNISDESSLDSERNQEVIAKRISAKQSRKSSKKTQSISHLQQQRNELKEKIVTEVLEKILPNITDYDFDGTNQQKPNKRSKIFEKIISWLKFIGCIELDLHDAVLAGSNKQLKKSLLKITTGKNANPELVNEYDSKGCTALSYAVKCKLVELVQTLLDYSAIPDFVDLPTGRTPLFYSVNNGTVDISRMLLQFGASANTVDNQCVSPMMLAAARNDVKHCKLLCAALADVDVQDDHGWTALHYAAYANASDVILFLLQEGANRHIKDRNRRKPMHIAKFKNHGNCIAALSSKSKIAF